jgi:spermidine/putrescine transport system ATP-binding protein
VIAAADGGQVGHATAVEIRALSKTFGTPGAGVIALDNVSISIRANEFFTLLGPSGCGKTTLLRMIAGFEYSDTGQILLYGEDIAMLPPFKRPINTVFQSYALFPHKSVAENVGFGLKMQHRPKAEIDARVAEMLRLVRLEELKDRRTSQISGGQQQRVALARALAPSPKVLLLDEPLSALDYKLRKEMQIELKRMQHETGITFIFVTHDQEEALTMSDRIAVMNNGRVLQIGSPREIYGRPADRFVAGFIGETNFVPCEIARNGAGKVDAKLNGGFTVTCEDDAALADRNDATLSIRPEQARAVAGRQTGMIHATVETVIFVGTGIQIHTRLSDGSPFMVRQPDIGSEGQFAAGQPVSIAINDGAARLLRN